MILEREGYRVVSQSQSQMADFWVIDEPVDLLILDNSESWDELWNQKLNKIRCQFARQPILILSAHLPGPATFDCEDFGFCKIIQKPSDPVVILENARGLLV
jgi:DNA-binding response OmpR family regulator